MSTITTIRYMVFICLLILTLFDDICTESTAQATSKNHQLLTKIGFTRVRSPNSHHRKRLAVESRHHQRSDDSHMFIVKLPPNPHYYTYSQPNHIDIPSSRNLPIGFKNNGKPAKVYHWNIPVLKKIVSNKYKSRHINDNNNNDDDDDGDEMIDFQNPENWNEVLDKPDKKQRKPIKPSYYVPIKKKTSFTKYFPGNGKPHSFYVIEKSKKAHYHRLLP